ncbi:MAG: acetylglutamate kinase [Bacteroidia bacterium]
MNSKNVLVVKYGGNAMSNEDLKKEVLQNLCMLNDKGYHIVIVHGGGPFIKQALEEAKIESEFIDGHRKTTPEALKHVEMALKGQVNSSLVGIINQLGYKAVGLSGKDGGLVTAAKRLHEKVVEGITEIYDLGQVGDVAHVDTRLLHLLLENGYLPVITCLAADSAGNTYNINADMFAGHLAGALHAGQYLVLTDVDGLMNDMNDSSTLIPKLHPADIERLIANKTIRGGMLPKVESCMIALENGAHAARIINGTKPRQIIQAVENIQTGTLITKQ